MTKLPQDRSPLATARKVLQAEASGIHQLEKQLGSAFEKAVKTIQNTKGHCIVTGLGKSGHIAKKISATLSSTGTHSFYVHPTEASHGDLGMIDADACVLAISNSGESREMRDIVVHCSTATIALIAITSNQNSFLAQNANCVLALPNAPEACPNGLAPTTSTTMTLALGDALAVSLMQSRGFTPEDFGARHPGGSLGQSVQKISTYLLENPMEVPVVNETASGREVISAITEGRQGCVAVLDRQEAFVGIITDGDLRRAMDEDFFDKSARQMMSNNPVTISPDARMKDAMRILTERRIANLFVVENGKVTGQIHSKDLLQQGYTPM